MLMTSSFTASYQAVVSASFSLSAGKSVVPTRERVLAVCVQRHIQHNMFICLLCCFELLHDCIIMKFIVLCKSHYLPTSPYRHAES